jgi:hypothetical protein
MALVGTYTAQFCLTTLGTTELVQSSLTLGADVTKHIRVVKNKRIFNAWSSVSLLHKVLRL